MQFCLRSKSFCNKNSYPLVLEIIRQISLELESGCNCKTSSWMKRINFADWKQKKQVYRRTSFLGPDNVNGLKVNSYWINTSFMSTSHDQRMAAGYSYNWGPVDENKVKYLLVFEMENYVKGAFIEKCSAVETDREFLVDEGQYWQVTSIKQGTKYQYDRYENYLKGNYKKVSGDKAVYTTVYLKAIPKTTKVPKFDIEL